MPEAAGKKTVRVKNAQSLSKVKKASLLPVSNVANVRRSFVITQRMTVGALVMV